MTKNADDPTEGGDTPGDAVSRRTAIRAGAVATGAILGGVSLTGNAAANGKGTGRTGIGQFLNEEAEFKDRPIWDSGIADMTGKSEVTVVVGAMTSVDIPEELAPPDREVPEQLPMAYSPRVVKVSPGTDVTWEWTSHHSVTSLEGRGELFDYHGEQGDSATHTFDDQGTYLYFCHPHGTPYELQFGDPIGSVENLFGMRGAVKVVDD